MLRMGICIHPYYNVTLVQVWVNLWKIGVWLSPSNVVVS